LFALGSARLLDFRVNTRDDASSQAFLQDNSGEYMEQRRLRLGDILDDYCPRERRVTNHAIVAMVEEDVKQTRCTTCDAEHVYKGGKGPRRKKVETAGKLYKQVLAGLTDDPVNPAAAPPAEPEMIDAEPDHDAEPIEAIADVIERAPARDDAPAQSDDDEIEDERQPAFLDDGPVHRPLIRAQLPRIEGVKAERQAPDFTIRQTAGRGNFRNGGGGGTNNNNGHRFGRGPHRGGGGRGGGGNQGFGRGPGGHGGGRKRGR
jgi:hypothetical protein